MSEIIKIASSYFYKLQAKPVCFYPDSKGISDR